MDTRQTAEELATSLASDDGGLSTRHPICAKLGGVSLVWVNNRRYWSAGAIRHFPTANRMAGKGSECRSGSSIDRAGSRERGIRA
jgi:hypothetical protein